MSGDIACPGCGSSLADRQKRADQYPDEAIPTDLSECQYCGAEKCCLCDMGDDVECISCDSEGADT